MYFYNKHAMESFLTTKEDVERILRLSKNLISLTIKDIRDIDNLLYKQPNNDYFTEKRQQLVVNLQRLLEETLSFETTRANMVTVRRPHIADSYLKAYQVNPQALLFSFRLGGSYV